MINASTRFRFGPFHADNGTAEDAASERYTGKISLLSANSMWDSVTNKSLPSFSAVCWYSGRHYFDSLKVKVPLGLVLGCVSGTPIEYWLRSVDDISQCGNISGRCWNSTVGKNSGLSHLYDQFIKPFVPLGGISAIIWDQAEADVNCHDLNFPTPQLGGDPAYSCLEKALIVGWRSAFSIASDVNNIIPWIAVQLPGYQFSPCPIQKNSVFDMRLGQEFGMLQLENTDVVPTYDLSCTNCPYGSIHPTDKEDVGARISLHLRKSLQNEDIIVS
eukprot:UC4_evm1s832